MVSLVDGKVRMRAVRLALADLQVEAHGVFAGSGETVNKFLQARREADMKEAAA